MSEYTPGPYQAEGPDPFGDYTIVPASGGLAIAAIVSNLRDVEEVTANAQLFMAAPDLLEAAKVALIVFGSMMEDPDFKPEATRDQIQQAIDKAEAPLEGRP